MLRASLSDDDQVDLGRTYADNGELQQPTKNEASDSDLPEFQEIDQIAERMVDGILGEEEEEESLPKLPLDEQQIIDNIGFYCFDQVGCRLIQQKIAQRKNGHDLFYPTLIKSILPWYVGAYQCPTEADVAEPIDALLRERTSRVECTL